jgi:hypothetical protein
MSEQIDIAVDLGAVPPALPDIVAFGDFMNNRPKAPPQLIIGILHQGCKMILGGHVQEQQIVVFAGPGYFGGQRAAVVGSPVRQGSGPLHQL